MLTRIGWQIKKIIEPINKIKLSFSNKLKKSITLSSTKQNYQLINRQKNSIIHYFIKKQIQQQSQNDQVSTKRTQKICQILQQNNIKNNGNNQFNKNYSKFQNQKQNKVKNIQHKNLSSTINICLFNIERQFQISIEKQNSRINVETQTYNSTVQDKYFYEYIKYRQLKQNSFKQIQQQEIRMRQIINSNGNFDKNHQNLISSIINGPLNDRQTRILSLSKDLLSYQSDITLGFQKIHQKATKFEIQTQKIIQLKKQKKNTLITSIQHLIQASFLQLKKQNNSINQQANSLSQSKKYDRILDRVKNQINGLRQFLFSQGSNEMKRFNKYNNEVLELKKKYDQFLGLLYQNRVLKYSLIKQVQKIPALMISLFGYDQQIQSDIQWNDESKLQSIFNEYMNTKCEQCYHMKKKIKHIKFINQKIKPVFKCLQWLIRDCSKNQCCLRIV